MTEGQPCTGPSSEAEASWVNRDPPKRGTNRGSPNHIRCAEDAEAVVQKLLAVKREAAVHRDTVKKSLESVDLASIEEDREALKELKRAAYEVHALKEGIHKMNEKRCSDFCFPSLGAAP